MDNTSQDDEKNEDNDEDEEKCCESARRVKQLLQRLADHERLAEEQQERIEGLKIDLVREKKLNDILIDQIILLKTNSGCDDASEGSKADNSELSLSLPITPAQRSKRDNGDSDSSAETLGKDPLAAENDRPNRTNDDDEHLGDDSDKGGTPDSDKEKRSPSQERLKEDTTKGLAKLHGSDNKRSKRLSYILNALKNQPAYKTTLLFGDSNFNSIYGELDPTNKSVAVRGISGLCVVAAAHALQQYDYRYTHIKKVVWALGTNDHLHRQHHCPDDWAEHLSTLFKETRRVFKGASVHFILPYKGLPKVPQDHINYVDETIKKVDPTVKRHFAPTVEGMVRGDGVHVNKEGALFLRKFLVKRFGSYSQVNRPTSNVNSGRVRNAWNTPPNLRGNERPQLPRDRNPNYTEGVVRGRSLSRLNSDNGRDPPQSMDQQFPPLRPPAVQYGLSERSRQEHCDPVQELSEALSQFMYAHLGKRMNY